MEIKTARDLENGIFWKVGTCNIDMNGKKCTISFIVKKSALDSEVTRYMVLSFERSQYVLSNLFSFPYEDSGLTAI